MHFSTKITRVPFVIVVLTLISLFASEPLVATSDSVTTQSEQSAILRGTMQRIKPGMYGWTHLMDAAVDGDLQSVKALLAKGAEVNAVNDRGGTALTLAAYQGHLDVARELIANGAEIDIKDKDGKTALSAAVERGHTAIAQELLARGADPNVKGHWGHPILKAAAVQGHAEIVNALISHGADTKAHGGTAFRHAASKGHNDIVRSLLAAGVDVNAATKDNDRTALFMAVENDHIETAQLLIDSGADVNKKTKRGISPLSLAVRNGQTETVDTLVSSGAAISVDLLTLAMTRGHSDIVERLFEHVDFSALTAEQVDTALILADRAGETNVANALLRIGTIRRKPEVSDDVRLVFVREKDAKCEITLWNPYTVQARQLFSSPTCPEDVFVADGKTSIFVPYNGVLQEIQFGPQVRIKAPIPLPKIDLEKRPYFKKYIKWLKPVAAGYLEQNKIGIVMHIGLPADDSYNFLYALEDGAWVLLEQKHCGCFDTCRFESLNGRGSGVWDWKRERRVWHPRHTANRYVIDRQFVRQSDVSFNSGKGTLTFGINGRTSILTFFIDPGPDTGATLTFGITLQVEGQSLAKLPGQCETSLAHKYLLFDRFWVGQTLIDLETGESVLGELKLATWIN